MKTNTSVWRKVTYDAHDALKIFKSPGKKKASFLKKKQQSHFRQRESVTQIDGKTVTFEVWHSVSRALPLLHCPPLFTHTHTHARTQAHTHAPSKRNHTHTVTPPLARSHSSLINNPSRRSADSRSNGGGSVAIAATRTTVLILLQEKHLFMCWRRQSRCQHGGLGRRWR